MVAGMAFASFTHTNQNLYTMRTILVSALCALTLFACQDPCKSVDCDFGQCTDGYCELWRNKVTGSYLAQNTCSNGFSEQTTVIITNGSNPDEIQFDNGFYGQMVSENEFQIPMQTYYDVFEQVNVTTSGSGSISASGQLTFTITITAQGQTNTCSIASL